MRSIRSIKSAAAALGVLLTIALPVLATRAALDASMSIADNRGARSTSKVIEVRSASSLKKYKTMMITRVLAGAQPLDVLYAHHEVLSSAILTINHPPSHSKKVATVELGGAVISDLTPPSGSTQQVTFTYQTISVTWTDSSKTVTDDWIEE